MTSFISMLGGVDAKSIEAKFNDISENLNALSSRIAELDAVVTKLDEYTMNLETGIRNNEICCAELKHKYSDEGLTKRVDDIDRMVRYFQSSHGKVLNDIRDLKKELHGLYGRQCPPPQKELDKSVAKDNSEILLSDIITNLIPEYHERGCVLKAMKRNGWKTVSDLLAVPYYQLQDRPWLGKKVLAVFQCIYEQYGKIDPRAVADDIPDTDLKKAIFDMEGSTKTKSRVYNMLKKEGIFTLEQLAQKSLLQLCTDHPDFRKGRAGDLLSAVYTKYIWTEGEKDA